MEIVSGDQKQAFSLKRLCLPTIRRGLFVTILFILLIPVYWIAINAPAVGIYHDDGIYIVTAKALAEGKGYRIISLPGETVQTKYPILFPALLAIVWKFSPRFPENAIYMKMIPLIGTILWVWLLHRFIKGKEKSSNISIGIIFITLASPWVVFFSVTVLSETIFAFLCTGALLSLHRLEEDTTGEKNRFIILSSILAAAAFLTRSAGLPLIIAGALSLLLRRKYRYGVQFILLCAILISPWIWWQSVQHDSNNATYAYYSSSSYRNWNILLNYSLPQKCTVLATNFLRLMFSPIRLLAFRYVHFFFDYSLSILFFAFVLFGILRDLRGGVKTIHIFLILYCGMLLVWMWHPIRFIVPILPFILYYAYKGFVGILKSVSSNERSLCIANRGLILILFFGFGNGLYYSTIQTLKTNQASVVYFGETIDENWMEFRSQLDWIRDHTPPDAVLLGMIDPTIYLYTGRKAVRGFVSDPYLLWYSDNPNSSLGNVSDLLHTLVKQKANYIIRTPSRMFSESPIFNSLLDEFLIRYKGTLRLEKEESIPGYRIYRVDQDKLRQILQDS